MYKDDENLLAILGPTNTGKTHKAFEKLLNYSSGIFGFPLRLLARENYDKAVKSLGLNRVALITGEEKIVPKEASHFFCTVESMPINKIVDCVIIDEVQLASDYERGHIFTDRLLNFRGTYETIFLGSLTIRNILKQLFPKIIIQEQSRFSTLSYIPQKNLSKLKPRSAIIAFNINKVYEIAENLRTHKGGAAVVLGSLSPRTRNAQVEIYENNKVDFLVATDAIGMGLNLNINHVCFSSLEKYDGKYTRNLHPNEIAQIAGRAGRYKTDGTFSNTKEAGNIDPLVLQSVENHKFDQIQKIYWRNSNIDFSSINSVISSLKKFPIKNIFIHKKNASDEINFRTLSDDYEVKKYLTHSDNVKLLWEISQIPDFEKVFNDNYLILLKTIFTTLIKNNNKIPEDWFNDKISKLQNFIGGIPELSIKISQIRTWTYVSNHRQWLKNPIYWQEKTQQIENDLSDNLHIGLTNKFVDTSSKFFLDSLDKKNIEKIEINQNNEIILDGEMYGFIHGFDIKLNKNSFSHSLFSFSHVKKFIRNMIEEKISTFLSAPDDSISFGDISNIKFDKDVNLYWGDETVGTLSKGSKILNPIAESYNSEFISSENKLLISAKLQNWLDNQVSNLLNPINEDLNDKMNSQIRAIAFNCFENLGLLPIENFKDYLKEIKDEDKITLSNLGIRIGAKYFFMPNLLKKRQIEFKALLWAVYNNYKANSILPLPKDGRVSFTAHTTISESYWNSIGYKCINNFAFRIDIFEKIFFLARKKIKYGPFLESADLMNPLGCNSDQLRDIMLFCNYEVVHLSDSKKIYFYKQINNKTKTKNVKNVKNIKNVKNTKKKIKKKTISKMDPNSPFAVLEKLL